MSKFAVEKVKSHFTHAREAYSTRKGIVEREYDPIILNFVKETCDTNSKFLEVGGGSGYMLDLIASETDTNYLCNLEIVPEVYKKQANERITLIGGDAVRLPFKQDSFDYAITNDLLHHLVGVTRKQSQTLQRRAVEELKRVVRDQGYIIIAEEYNRHRFFASIIFWLTLLFSLFSISFKSFGLRKNVIVSFLTAEEVNNLLTQANTEVLLSKEKRWKVPMKYKLTLLMRDIGRLLVIGKVNKKANAH